MADVSEVFEYNFKKYIINLPNFEKYLMSLNVQNLLYTTYSGLDNSVKIYFSIELTDDNYGLLTNIVDDYVNSIPVPSTNLNKYFDSTINTDFRVSTDYTQLILDKNNYIDNDSYEILANKTGVKILNSGRYLIFGMVHINTGGTEDTSDPYAIDNSGRAVLNYSSRGNFLETTIYGKGQFCTLINLPDNFTRNGDNILSIYVKSDSSSGSVIKANNASLVVVKLVIDGLYNNSKYFKGITQGLSAPISSTTQTNIVMDTLRFVDAPYIYDSETGKIKLLEPGKYLVISKVSTSSPSTITLLVNESPNVISDSITGIMTILDVPEMNTHLQLQAKCLDPAGNCILQDSCLTVSKLQSLVTLEPNRGPQETSKYYSKYDITTGIIDTTYFWNIPENLVTNIVDSYYTQLPEEVIQVEYPGVYVIHYQLNTQAKDIIIVLNLNDTIIRISQTNVLNTCVQLLKEDIISIQLMSNTLETIEKIGSSITLMCLDDQQASTNSQTYIFYKRYPDHIVVVGDSFITKCEARIPVIEDGRYHVECVADFSMIADSKEFEVKFEVGKTVVYQKILKSGNPANATTVTISQDIDIYNLEPSLVKLSFRVLNFIDECVCSDTLIAISRINLQS